MSTTTPVEPISQEEFEMRDHIVVGIGRDELGPFWSALGQALAPTIRESATSSENFKCNC